jgi:hypothetical protein
MTSTLFYNGRVLDPNMDALSSNSSVLVRDGRIVDVSSTTIEAEADETIDLPLADPWRDLTGRAYSTGGMASLRHGR